MVVYLVDEGPCGHEGLFGWSPDSSRDELTSNSPQNPDCKGLTEQYV